MTVVKSTAKGRALLAAEIKAELTARKLTQTAAVEAGGSWLAQPTLSKFVRADNYFPYATTLAALDKTFGWGAGDAKKAITARGNGVPDAVVETPEEDAPDPVVTGDPDLDAELRAIIDIRFILDSLEYPAQRRVIHWAAERYGA